VLVLAIGPFRAWLSEHMIAHELTAADVARRIGRDEALVRGWFGVRGWGSASAGLSCGSARGMPARRMGQRLRFQISVVEAWLHEQQAGPAA
jgi:hypothetical protein